MGTLKERHTQTSSSKIFITYLMASLLGHLATLSHRVGDCHLFGHLLTVLLGHILALLMVSVPTAHFLIGGGALLLIGGLGAALHSHPALCVLDRGAELPVSCLLLRLALGPIARAALSLQLGGVAGLNLGLTLPVRDHSALGLKSSLLHH